MYVPVILIFQFAIYRTVCSSPIPPNTIKSRAQLPLLLVLLSFISLFVLFFIKLAYITRRRRTEGTDASRTTLRSGWYDNLSTSSSRFGKLFMGSGDVKSGFLIGLLGSPSWETRRSAVIVNRSPSVSSRKSPSGLSLSHGSKSRSSLCCGPARSPVPDTLVNNTRPMSPPPAVTINRSPLLSDGEHMRLLNGRISATFPSGITSLVNSRAACRPCIHNASSSSFPASSGTIQAEYLHFVGQGGSNLATNNPPFMIPSPTPKPTEEASSSLNTTQQDTQKPLESFSVALSFPNFVPRFESALSVINEHSNSAQPQSSQTTPKRFAPSSTLRATHTTKLSPSYKGSPKIGPSPLRTMLLPPDGYPDYFRTFSSHRGGHRVRSHPHGAIGMHPAVELSSLRSPVPKKSTDTDSLLSELAKETSAWEPNVFIDENFRRLVALQHSKPQGDPKEQTVRPRRPSWRSSRHRKIQHVFTTLEDIPEVDVTDMMPSLARNTFIHSFWPDEGQFMLI